MLNKIEENRISLISGGSMFDMGSYEREDGATMRYYGVMSGNYRVWETSGDIFPSGGQGPKNMTKDDPTGGASIDYDERFSFRRHEWSGADLAKDIWRSGEHADL